MVEVQTHEGFSEINSSRQLALFAYITPHVSPFNRRYHMNGQTDGFPENHSTRFYDNFVYITIYLSLFNMKSDDDTWRNV